MALESSDGLKHTVGLKPEVITLSTANLTVLKGANRVPENVEPITEPRPVWQTGSFRKAVCIIVLI